MTCLTMRCSEPRAVIAHCLLDGQTVTSPDQGTHSEMAGKRFAKASSKVANLIP